MFFGCGAGIGTASKIGVLKVRLRRHTSMPSPPERQVYILDSLVESLIIPPDYGLCLHCALTIFAAN